ncbi:hypothetical protein CIW48_29245 [Methylobacterium sp. P1-11]|nr:hypothetical protein CIW48_29245 [Methylobacterium sp. P1-11]
MGRVGATGGCPLGSPSPPSGVPPSPIRRPHPTGAPPLTCSPPSPCGRLPTLCLRLGPCMQRFPEPPDF